MGEGVKLVRCLLFDAYNRPFVDRFNQYFKDRGGSPRRTGRSWEQWDVQEMRARFSVEAREPKPNDEAALKLEYERLLADSVRVDAPLLNPEEHPGFKPSVVLPLPWFTQPDGPHFGHRLSEVHFFEAFLEDVRLQHGLPEGIRLTPLNVIAKVIYYEGWPASLVMRFNDALVDTFLKNDPIPLETELKDPAIAEMVKELPHRVRLDPTRPDLRAELRRVIVQLRRRARAGERMELDHCTYCGGLYAMWPATLPDRPRYCDGHGGACSRADHRLPR